MDMLWPGDPSSTNTGRQRCRCWRRGDWTSKFRKCRGGLESCHETFPIFYIIVTLFSIFMFKFVLHQVRRKGNMASMSGADDAVYLEKKGGRQGTFRSIKSDVIILRRVIVLMWNFRQETHPLFKRFRMAKWWRRFFNANGVGWHPTGTGGGDHLLGHPYIAHLKSRLKIGP